MKLSMFSWESRGDKAFIKIYMNDRVSLLPIPIASFSDGEVNVGAFLMDSNFLGVWTQPFFRWYVRQ